MWTYSNTWYWGSGNGIITADPSALTLAMGLGIPTARRKTDILRRQGAQAGNCGISIPPDSYLKPWTFTSSDNRFEMEFVPCRPRRAHQCVARRNGQLRYSEIHGGAVLDDGTVLEIKNLMGLRRKSGTGINYGFVGGI